MPSSAYDQARGLVNGSRAGSAAWNSSAARLRLPGSPERPTTVPSAQSARPWLSSDPHVLA